MRGKVVTVFDSFALRDEAIRYAVRLARRTESALVLLVLLQPEAETSGQGQGAVAREVERRATESLVGHMREAREAGVSVVAEVRMGDPSSELMKFLAGSRSVQTIVWGGQGRLEERRGSTPHWLSRMKSVLECPVVVPSRRATVGTGRGG